MKNQDLIDQSRSDIRNFKESLERNRYLLKIASKKLTKKWEAGDDDVFEEREEIETEINRCDLIIEECE